jgi:hypothetical protein
MAQGLDTTQARLLGILYRFDCPPALSIGEYALDLLERPACTDLAWHLLQCPLCAAELSAFLAIDL